MILRLKKIRPFSKKGFTFALGQALLYILRGELDVYDRRID